MKARWCIPLVVVGTILAFTWAAGQRGGADIHGRSDA
jgi:hypothetical protein